LKTSIDGQREMRVYSIVKKETYQDMNESCREKFNREAQAGERF
jgi:hypothetical protein